MRKVAFDDVDPATFDPERRTHDRRPLTDALNLADVAIVRYVLEPGERFSGAVHAHADQEEIFVVLEGTATFETPDGEVTVGPDEAIRFAPGEFQSGYNAGDDEVVALALGAPRDTEKVWVSRIPERGQDVACPACGRESMRFGHEGEADLVCPDCGTESSIE